LGLLLAATEQWKAAGEILERGAELGEDDREETIHEEESGGNDSRDMENGDCGAESPIETLEADNQTLRRPSSVSMSSDNKTDLGDLAQRVANGNGNATTNINGNTKGSRPPLYLLEKDATQIPFVASMLKPMPDHELPSKQEVFEYSLQLRMSQAALTEVVEGAEGAELKWVDIFSWHARAEKKASGSERMFFSVIGSGSDVSHLYFAAIATPRPSMDGSRPSPEKSAPFSVTPPSTSEHPTHAQVQAPSDVEIDPPQNHLQPIPITISPAPPEPEPRTSSEKPEKKNYGGLRVKRSSSIDRDTSTSKKVQQMLKNRVHKGRAGITTISRKIGSGVVKNGSLKKSSSTPGRSCSHHSKRWILMLTTAP
jgi:hypothetical protein